MKCEIVQNEELVERYVLGQLGEAEEGAFEEHFFACTACFEEVQLMQTLQAAAAERPRAKGVSGMPGRKWMMWGAAAALVVAGFGIAGMMRVKQRTERPVAKMIARPEIDLQLLAHVEAPRYTAPNLRGAAGNRDEQFRAAMAKYNGGDYAAAAQGLRGLETAAARFYLGIADLMTGNPDDAVAQLRGTEALGETPYLEEARFFLAKALLAKKDVAGAKQALEQTVTLSGDREAEARRMLEQLRALPGGQ